MIILFSRPMPNFTDNQTIFNLNAAFSPVIERFSTYLPNTDLNQINKLFFINSMPTGMTHVAYGAGYSAHYNVEIDQNSGMRNHTCAVWGVNFMKAFLRFLYTFFEKPIIKTIHIFCSIFYI